MSFGYEGSICRLAEEQQTKLVAWITGMLPQITCWAGGWIEAAFGIAGQGRPGLIALPHRLGMAHRTPCAVSRTLGSARQAAFIEAYEDLPERWANLDEPPRLCRRLQSLRG